MALQTLAELKVVKAAAYGGGAVIDYAADGGLAQQAVLILDADGLYHLAFIGGQSAQQTVGTPLAPQFDAAAKAAVDALRDKDCAAFLESSSPQLGPGAGGGDACAFVEDNPLGDFLGTYPKVQPRRLGGNGTYAFYGLRGPEGAFTFVMARDPLAATPEGSTSSQEAGAEYGYVAAYQVNAGSLAPP